ncbi:uncharacterized protein BP5553_07759 [Venustampulla echinocandica]|uniref:C2 domain-containing protein n=1 Tax=Venustampulla echinocandica TaxID=2656787 RepID=A0A370THF3_9HELO|nr:uncharacterized protein BP5553_07759 [Venustampulla echinocandica]RDL34631.1 hypothetical protein BP5553_07759 [Venustampulla echinocandica]
MSIKEAPEAPSGVNGDTSAQNKDPAMPSGGAKAKVDKAKEKLDKKQQKLKEKTNPAGGYDATPIPPARDGYTIKFTFHRAENLPMSDLSTRSSDPFIRATLTAPLQKRHKEDPNLVFRTPTIQKNTDPEWNSQWIVAGIPSAGFKLKCRLYDEDAQDHDDRLGNVTIVVDHLGADWPGFREEKHSIKKRMGSKRAYLVRGCAAMLSNVDMSGSLWVSAELLGKSDPPHGRMYTVGETRWFKHYSPMIGRIVGMKAPDNKEGDGAENRGSKIEKHDFQANQLQLQGPVPAELYHRFVEFKPFVKGMFSKAGLRGRILNKALHHQHARIYNFDSTTEYGVMPPCSKEAALQFLKMAHYDEGARIFTYVLTLDGMLRFTETGKEFGIDLLSKHTMHSDVNIYIACSGEFLIRRLKHPEKPVDDPDQVTHPEDDVPGGPPHTDPPNDPQNYELIIDNDSGTYRPKGDLLPLLKEFLGKNFPGLHVVVKECTDEKLIKMKEGQREKKKKEGKHIRIIQNSDDDLSSSDEERLNDENKKSGREKALNALENPKGAAKELMAGLKHKSDNAEAAGNKAEVNGGASTA